MYTYRETKLRELINTYYYNVIIYIKIKMYCIIYCCYEKIYIYESDIIRYIMMIIILYELTVGHFNFRLRKKYDGFY